LVELEKGERPAPSPRHAELYEEEEPQQSFGSLARDEVIERLKTADLNVLTPIECMNLLFELKKTLDSEGGEN
ncbi:MAG: hypothetical protein II808_03480, partial [Clostridia bacterium]|nr:hypothetical protein [Clostridia bacterium]